MASQRSLFNQRRISKHNAEIEKAIAKEYAFLYGETKRKVQELYATFGPTMTLAESRKYNKLTNLLIEARKQYEKLTGRTITKAEMLSQYNYTQEYFGAMWEAESAYGQFKWKNPQIEAIRASVFWEGTGLDLTKRFGKNMTAELFEIESAITRGIANSDGYRKTAEALQDAFDGGFNNALRVVRTESTRNRTEGFNAAWDSMKESGLPVKKQWIATMDNRTRTFAKKDKFDHMKLDGLESDEKGMFDVGQGIGLIAGPGLSGFAGFDINCFLPDTIVSGDFIAGSKVYYSGKIVEIHTASGKRLSITPNHRIATDSGWIKANELTKGMNAIGNCDVINSHNGGKVNNQQSVSTIKDIFESIGIHGTFRLMDIITGLYFDGDSKFMNGAINIVDMNIELGISIDSVIASKGIENINFMITETMNIFMESNCSLDFFRDRMLSTFGSNPCFTALPYNGIGVLFDFGPFKFFSVGPSSGLYTGLCKQSKYNPSAYSKFNTKLFDALTGIIQFDEIIDIVYHDFSGHVYDLQSLDGYIMSNGIMSSNCRCSVGTFFDDEGPRMTSAELDAEWDAWSAKNKVNETVDRLRV